MFSVKTAELKLPVTIIFWCTKGVTHPFKERPNIYKFSYYLIFYPTILTFNNIVGIGEMLITSIFSFSHNVFYFSQGKFSL